MLSRVFSRMESYSGEIVRPLYGKKKRQQLQLLAQDLLVLGRHTYGVPSIDSYQGSEAKVIIGKYCSISKGVIFMTGGIHPPGWVSIYPFRIKFGLKMAFKDGMPFYQSGRDYL